MQVHPLKDLCSMQGCATRLIKVGGASLSWCVRLGMVHSPVLADENTTLKDLDHFQRDVQGNGDQVAVQDEARDEGVNTHHPRPFGVCVPFCTVRRQVPVHDCLSMASLCLYIADRRRVKLTETLHRSSVSCDLLHSSNI